MYVHLSLYKIYDPFYIESLSVSWSNRVGIRKILPFVQNSYIVKSTNLLTFK